MCSHAFPLVLAHDTTGFDPVDRSTDSVVSYVGECGSHNPDPYPFYKCKECQGSCHYDDDCGNGLKCKHRVGYEAVPGCTGEAGEFDVYGKNICYNPSLPDVGLGATDCALTNDCAICTNCTVDNDCQGELRCAVRDADKTVPGCSITQATTPSLSSDTNICKLLHYTRFNNIILFMIWHLNSSFPLFRLPSFDFPW